MAVLVRPSGRALWERLPPSVAGRGRGLERVAVQEVSQPEQSSSGKGGGKWDGSVRSRWRQREACFVLGSTDLRGVWAPGE